MEQPGVLVGLITQRSVETALDFPGEVAEFKSTPRYMLKIEFLYYDKTRCKRCVSTDKSVKLTLRELKKAIKDSKMRIDFRERKLPKSKIHLSPTILINGKDIEKLLNKSSKFKSSTCSDCCQLAGHPVKCRTFSYRGRRYDFIPGRMIMDAVKAASRSDRH